MVKQVEEENKDKVRSTTTTTTTDCHNCRGVKWRNSLTGVEEQEREILSALGNRLVIGAVGFLSYIHSFQVSFLRLRRITNEPKTNGAALEDGNGFAVRSSPPEKERTNQSNNDTSM